MLVYIKSLTQFWKCKILVIIYDVISLISTTVFDVVQLAKYAITYIC